MNYCLSSMVQQGNGFWDRTPSELDDMAAQIEAKL